MMQRGNLTRGGMNEQTVTTTAVGGLRQAFLFERQVK
jgi:hypothetical protein